MKDHTIYHQNEIEKLEEQIKNVPKYIDYEVLKKLTAQLKHHRDIIDKYNESLKKGDG